MNKRNLVFTAGLLVLFAAFVIVGCFKNSDTRLTENKSPVTILINTNDSYEAEFEIDGNTFRYHSEIQNGKTKSTLKVLKDKAIIYESLYDYDTTINDYRLVQHKNVEKLAKSLKLDLKSIELATLSSQAKALLDAIFKSSGVRKRHVQSLFFHIAIMNTKLRAMQRNDNVYECVPVPEYLLGKSYFWRQEDVLIKVDLIKQVFKDNPFLMKDAQAKNLSDYIATTKKEYLSYDEVYSFSVSKDKYLQALDIIYAKNNPHNIASQEAPADCAWWCPLGCGSDLGCCGNYSGCCLLWSVNCLVHDLQCINCEPAWYCLPGCIPG